MGWFAHPLYHGDYPELMKNRIAHRSHLEGYNNSRLPEFSDKEKAYIKGTIDFFSLQTYFAYVVSDLKEPEFNSSPSFDTDLATNATSISNPEVKYFYFDILY